MTGKRRNKTSIGSKNTSSVSVSGQIVCEDEACIGKAAKSGDPWPPGRVQPHKKMEKSADTSMSLGGKETCSDDACIGKK